MNLLIIGATGRTGQLVLNQALILGHKVTVFVRNPKLIKPRGNLTIVDGLLEERELLMKTMAGQDAVIVTLGNPQSNKSAKLFEFAIPAIITAMEKTGVKRLLNLSAMGVGPTYQNAPIHYKIAAKTFLKGSFRDHWLGEKKLLETQLDWTTIHPGILNDRAKTTQPLVREASTSFKMPLLSGTSRADVAQVMLQMLEDKMTYQKSFVMCSKQDKSTERKVR